MQKISERLRRILEKFSRRSRRSEDRGRLSRHFTRSEFECKCGCGFGNINPDLIDVLEGIRSYFNNRPITILSGCRCSEHNHSVGGARKSQHLLGNAADFFIADVEPKYVYAYIDHTWPDRFGVGQYENWIHLDVRVDPARWHR